MYLNIFLILILFEITYAKNQKINKKVSNIDNLINEVYQSSSEDISLMYNL